MKYFFCLYFLLMALPTHGQTMYGLEEVVIKAPDGRVKKLYDASWAVLIGVNDYTHWPKLSYAVADVDSMKRVLVEKLGFPEGNIYTLTNEDVTLKNMKTLLGVTLPEKAGANDRVLIFYAGHGGTRTMPSGGNMGFLIPYDAPTDDARYIVDCLSMRDIRAFASLIPSKHILFLVDACYSGLSVDASYSETDARPFDFRFADAPIRQVITAGRAGEQVIERDEWGHSAFAYQFLLGMNTGLADTDGDGLVTGTELAGYLKPKVTRLSGNRQTPVFRPWGGEGEFVFVLNEAERLRREAQARFQSAQTAQEAAAQARLENEKLESEIRRIEAEQARARQVQLEQEDYNLAERTGTISAFENFMGKYPNSGYVEAAQKQVARIQLTQEQEAFEKAKNAGSEQALEGFINAHPNSQFVRAARNEITNIHAREAEAARLAEEEARKSREAEEKRRKLLEDRLNQLRGNGIETPAIDYSAKQIMGYRVQVAALLDSLRAEIMKQRIQAQLKMRTYVFYDKDVHLYRLLVGNYYTADGAGESRDAIRRRGFPESHVVRTQIEGIGEMPMPEFGEMVYISDFGFWIDTYEVTNAQFARFLNAEGNQIVGGVTWLEDSRYVLIEQRNGEFVAKSNYANHPVIEVSWHGAKAYCEWAGKRLPSLDEWQQACQGTDGRKYPWGNADPNAGGEYRANYDPGNKEADGFASTAPVGDYLIGSSPYGALDMAGNVWEWTATKSGSNRMICGGSWSGGSSHLHCTDRSSNRPDQRLNDLGFRCVR